MKREQHELIVERFGLERYDEYNRISNWSDTSYELEFAWANANIDRMGDEFVILNSTMVLYQSIPSRELADEVLQFIKDTEVLFI